MKWLMVLMLLTTGVSAGEVMVATAANFYPTLNRIKPMFEQQTGDTVKIIRGSTGKLYAQIMHGAPYDIFLAADTHRPDLLIKQQKVESSDGKIYARGQLVLWKPGADDGESLKSKLISGEFNKLAIANPKTAPYGRAAIETLKAMGAYEMAKSRLVYAENIAQALHFVQSGAADLGLIAKSLVNNDEYWSVDSTLHEPIEQKMVLTQRGKTNSSARKFFEFMQSDIVQKQIAADGYLY